MGSLAVRARVRLEALYNDAFGAPPQAGVLLPRRALAPGDDAEERVPAVRGFRVAPIVMTDGLFEYEFRVIDVTEPVRGEDVIYVFARQCWPVLIGAASGDAEAAAAEIDAARRQAQRWSADELWVADLSAVPLDIERVRLGLMQVYRPAGNAG